MFLHRKEVLAAEGDKNYNKNYEYIEYFRKAMSNSSDPEFKESALFQVISAEAERDFYEPSLRQINHLIQIDEKPNQEITEPRWEIYKISVSFTPKGKTVLLRPQKAKTWSRKLYPFSVIIHAHAKKYF